MEDAPLNEIWHWPVDARPAVLEGRWLGSNGAQAYVAANPVSVLEGGPEAFEELGRWLTCHAARYPAGAAIGFLSYELGRLFEPVPLAKLSSLPDVSFAYYPRVRKLAVPAGTSPLDNLGPPTKFHTNFDQESYQAAVTKIREYITAGDIYQANLTVRFSVGLEGQPAERIYQRLRGSRAPFRAFLKSPDRTILSNSPERFFRVFGERVLASPIKGTIARGAHDDEETRAKLLASPKDRAENVMIVDLLRNDLGRICRYQTIRVRLWETEPLPHLFHLVSHVEGTLRPGIGFGEILRALFPCGSVTGAPKIRAMEILAEIERVPRGVSMGAVGIIFGLPGSNRCRMEFNVAIRTLLLERDVATFNVGGGIVYDSQARTEHEEMMLKAQPLLAALGALSSGKTCAMNAVV